MGEGEGGKVGCLGRGITELVLGSHCGLTLPSWLFGLNARSCFYRLIRGNCVDLN